MFANFDFDVIARSWQTLLFNGLGFTLEVTVLSMIGGILVGTLLALMRLSSIKPLAWAAGTYVNVLRAIPLVLVIFWFYFLVPYIAAWIVGSPTPLRVGAFNSAVVTFTLFEAAYFCEIMRAGIQSISRGQVSASMALGLNHWQGMRYVILPQAIRNMVPALLTRVIILFQDTSLVYAIGAYDLLKGFDTMGKQYGRTVESYLLAAVVYFILCYSLSWMVKRLHKKIAIIR